MPHPNSIWPETEQVYPEHTIRITHNAVSNPGWMIDVLSVQSHYALRLSNLDKRACPLHFHEKHETLAHPFSHVSFR